MSLAEVTLSTKQITSFSSILRKSCIYYPNIFIYKLAWLTNELIKQKIKEVLAELLVSRFIVYTLYITPKLKVYDNGFTFHILVSSIFKRNYFNCLSSHILKIIYGSWCKNEFVNSFPMKATTKGKDQTSKRVIC